MLDRFRRAAAELAAGLQPPAGGPRGRGRHRGAGDRRAQAPGADRRPGGDRPRQRRGARRRDRRHLRADARAMTYAPLDGAAVGDAVTLLGPAGVHPAESWVGRIVDAFGQPLDGRPLAPGAASATLRRAAAGAGDPQGARARGSRPGSRLRHRAAGGAGPAHRRVRGLGHRQVVAARRSRARHRGRHRGLCPDRRARARAARFRRQRARARGHGARGGGRRDLRPGAADQAPRRLDGDGDAPRSSATRAATCSCSSTRSPASPRRTARSR